MEKISQPVKFNKGENLQNILIVVFDALTARNMSIYGYPRQTTPNLEELAARATVFHRHYAGGNFTTPGTASLLTGTYPWSHRALNIFGTVDDPYADKNVFSFFKDSYETIAFSHNTYANILFDKLHGNIEHWTRFSELCLTSDSNADKYIQGDFDIAFQAEERIFLTSNGLPSSFFGSRFSRLRRYLTQLSLYREYEQLFPLGLPTSYVSNFTIEQVVDWLSNEFDALPHPFMGYIHLLPPHDPYCTRHEFVDIFNDAWKPITKTQHFFSEGYSDDVLAYNRRLYDEFIAYVDFEFGRLFEVMDKKGILNQTLLIFTSDHGEMFERGIWRHNNPTLYEPLIHIPLLIWHPEINQRKDVFAPTSCVDILPTLIYLMGKTIPDWCEGQVLPGYGNCEGDDSRSLFVVEAKGNSTFTALTRATIAMVKGRYKLVYYMGYEGYQDEYEFYDLEADPEELFNLYASMPDVAKAMQEEITTKLAQVNQPYQHRD